jgi:hypothetical protein
MTSGLSSSFPLAVISLAAAQNAGKGVLVLPQDPAHFLTEKKLALVIDNYPEESGLIKLKWGANDATDLAARVDRQGYMLKRLDPNSGAVVFASSGHGGQVGRGV